MKRYKMDDPEVDLEVPNKYKVIVELYIAAESTDSACEIVKDIIDEIKLNKIDEENNETINDYDIVDCEPAEVYF